MVPGSRSRSVMALALVFAAAALPLTAEAREPRLPGQAPNLYGMPGAINMPTATAFADGTLAFTLNLAPDRLRANVAFQLHPRVTAAFRYTGVRLDGAPTYFDRAFDIHVLLAEESRFTPALAVGLRDFIGTGIDSSEYVVATKTLTPELQVSAGIGWGQMATRGGFANPLGGGFRTRPGGFTGQGGVLETDRFFRGDAAVFGAVSYQATPRLRLVAEYSSETRDAMVRAARAGGAIGADDGRARGIPLSFGAQYAVSDSAQVSAYLLQGRDVGVQFSLTLDPRRTPQRAQHPAPLPVSIRDVHAQAAAAQAGAGGWVTASAEAHRAALARADGTMLPLPAAARDPLAEVFREQGLRLRAAQIGGTLAGQGAPDIVLVRFSNTAHDVHARAEGRAARILAAAMPPSVETFVLVHAMGGVDIASRTLRRSDLEALQHSPEGGAAMRAAILSGDGTGLPALAPGVDPGAGVVAPPRLDWSIAPYLETSYFDPDQPVRIDAGLRGTLRFNLTDRSSVNMIVAGRLFGNIGAGRVISPEDRETLEDAGFAVVRSDGTRFYQRRVAIERLSYDHLGRPGENLYSRVSVGYLERAYAGVAGQLLWAPPDSNLALGLEATAVTRRDPDRLLGLGSYSTVTGHVSAHYDFGNSYNARLDVGRYLAGDYGATLTLEREFANGIRVGAYATLTNMPFSVFGEGSFDKGLYLNVPFSVFTGQPGRAQFSTTFQPITRDGGARVAVGDLYQVVREHRGAKRAATQEAFWQ